MLSNNEVNNEFKNKPNDSFHKLPCLSNNNSCSVCSIGLVFSLLFQFVIPAYTEDTQESRLHSWQVLLLPYLEQESLYDKIRLNKP